MSFSEPVTEFSRDLWDAHLALQNNLIQQTKTLLEVEQQQPLEIPPNDEVTMGLIRTGEYPLVLFSSDLSRWLMRHFQPESLQELVTLLPFNRICKMFMQMSSFRSLVRGKGDPASIELPHPALIPILQETHGVLVFKEQAVEIVETVTDFNIDQVYELVGRPRSFSAYCNPEDRRKFVESAGRKGIDPTSAWVVLAFLMENSALAFPRKVAEDFVRPSYEETYLATHYPEVWNAVKAQREDAA